MVTDHGPRGRAASLKRGFLIKRRHIMKWFKHDSNAVIRPKMKKLILKYGMEGYGLYWYCLEAIARGVDRNNLTFELEEDAEIISAGTGIHPDKVTEMMMTMIDIGLFQAAKTSGLITCLQLVNMSDKYTEKIMREEKKTVEYSGNIKDYLAK